MQSQPLHSVDVFILDFIFSVLAKYALHIMLYIVTLTHDRWHKICQAVQESADNKLTLTVIRDTKCMATSTAQHFLAPLCSVCVICHVSKLECKNAA